MGANFLELYDLVSVEELGQEHHSFQNNEALSLFGILSF